MKSGIFLSLSPNLWPKFNSLLDLLEDDDVYFGDNPNNKTYGRVKSFSVPILKNIPEGISFEKLEADFIKNIAPFDIKLGELTSFKFNRKVYGDERYLADCIAATLDKDELLRIKNIIESKIVNFSLPQVSDRMTLAFMKTGQAMKYVRHYAEYLNGYEFTVKKFFYYSPEDTQYKREINLDMSKYIKKGVRPELNDFSDYSENFGNVKQADEVGFNNNY